MSDHVAPKHDFVAKLRQPSVLPGVRDYILWQREVRRARKAGLEPPEMPVSHGPVSINLDFTTACNYRCDHCADWDILNTADKHNEQILRDSLTEMRSRGLRSVILIGGGEPTVYPAFSSMTRFLKDLGLQVAIVSNGSGNKKILEIADCLDERDWVRLSLDSSSNDTFIRMHRPVNPAITLESICEWVPKIKKVNPRPKFGFSFIIVWEGAECKAKVKIVENIHEIVAATKLARDSQFDYISLKPFLLRSETDAEVIDLDKATAHFNQTIVRIRAAVDEAKTYQTDNFRVLESTNLRMLEDGSWRDFTNQPKMCHMQALHQVLTPTGVYNCPTYRGIERAKIANKDGYKDGDTAKETNQGVANILERFNAHLECAQISCMYNAANWWLESAVSGESDVVIDPSEERFDYFL
jgi:organic radical activating enzyme